MRAGCHLIVTFVSLFVDVSWQLHCDTWNRRYSVVKVGRIKLHHALLNPRLHAGLWPPLLLGCVEGT